LRLPAGMIKDLMEVFQRTKLVLPLADDETFVLSRAPETISLKDILDCVRNAGPKTKLNPSNRNQDERQIDTLLSKVDQSIAEALEGKSLQKLILGEVLVSQRKSSA
jgi:DNA-binding IscR family transcriptional regulator